MQLVRTEPTSITPTALDVKTKVVRRMKKLLLTAAQIKKEFEVVQGEQELTTFLVALFHPFQRDLEQDSETAYTEKTIAGLTINKLKSTCLRIYAV
jgi:hypothetical protein